MQDTVSKILEEQQVNTNNPAVEHRPNSAINNDTRP